MSQVVSSRLPDETAERLQRFARRLDKSLILSFLLDEHISPTVDNFLESA